MMKINTDDPVLLHLLEYLTERKWADAKKFLSDENEDLTTLDILAGEVDVKYQTKNRLVIRGKKEPDEDPEDN